MVPFLAQNYRVITFDPRGNGRSDRLRDLRIWYMTGAIDYSAPGRLTDIGEVSVAVLEAVPADPAGICRLVPGLVLHPFEATDLGLDAGRLGGQEIRQASAIIRAVLALDPAASGSTPSICSTLSCPARRTCSRASSSLAERPGPVTGTVTSTRRRSAWRRHGIRFGKIGFAH
jgi:pimeloyl-ACP methyl ester carboxylesterase